MPYRHEPFPTAVLQHIPEQRRGKSVSAGRCQGAAVGSHMNHTDTPTVLQKDASAPSGTSTSILTRRTRPRIDGNDAGHGDSAKRGRSTPLPPGRVTPPAPTTHHNEGRGDKADPDFTAPPTTTTISHQQGRGDKVDPAPPTQPHTTATHHTRPTPTLPTTNQHHPQGRGVVEDKFCLGEDTPGKDHERLPV